jgi:uncharacterized protein (UPF0276 family)
MPRPLRGVGLGFRREIAQALIEDEDRPPHFIEVAPENWVDVGGFWGRQLSRAVEKYPLLCHGLSLSIGSPDPIDYSFLDDVKHFFQAYPVEIYSEHLNYSKCDNAHLYDLLPIPFTEEAVRHVAGRVREVQNYLGRRIALENVSYYTAVTPEMDEASFVRAVVEEADCDLLLDINNVYVNSFNHGYDPRHFLRSLPLERVRYVHMAGHAQESDSLMIDAHDEPSVCALLELFEWALPFLPEVPVLLERDFNFPAYAVLKEEMWQLQDLVNCARNLSYVS